MEFSYSEFIKRNIGFVTENEQEILRKTRLFVPGVGGMGGAVIACLARAGFENFIIADIDVFEVSNLNRQVFSSLDVIGEEKTKVVKKTLCNINPNIQVDIRNGAWVNDLDEILTKTDIVVNGCDDAKSTIQLMRKCKQFGITAIDAFASPLPNVYVIKPQDKRPEEIFGFPTVNIEIEKIDKNMEAACKIKEIEHVMVHSNSSNYIDMNIAKEIISGKRSRISFAPMVWATGCMMAYEAVRIALKKPGGPGVKGFFFNPWTYQIEKPRGWLSEKLRKIIVNKFLKNL